MKSAKQRSLSKSKDKIKLTWEQYIEKIYQLASIIKLSDVNFDYVFGIPRGGLIPATIISHELDLDLLPLEDAERNYCAFGMGRCGSECNILIVDDVIDTGKTLKSFNDMILNDQPKFLYTATIFKHVNSPFSPDFYVTENNQWICYPYEKE